MAKTLVIKSEKNTPMVKFDSDRFYLEIEGRSIPENAPRFYRPVLEVIQESLKKNPPSCKVRIFLEYLNSSSKVIITEVFSLLKNIDDVSLEWVYEEDDEDMFDMGKIFEERFNFKFTFTGVEDI